MRFQIGRESKPQQLKMTGYPKFFGGFINVNCVVCVLIYVVLNA
jgi:hypothetical protein